MGFKHIHLCTVWHLEGSIDQSVPATIPPPLCLFKSLRNSVDSALALLKAKKQNKKKVQNRSSFDTREEQVFSFAIWDT